MNEDIKVIFDSIYRDKAAGFIGVGGLHYRLGVRYNH